MEENILLRVGIDQDQISKSEKAIVSARNEIDRLKNEVEKNTESFGKNSVEVARNQAAIKNQSQVIRENERVLISNNKILAQQDSTTKQSNGSIIAMRESVKTLTAEYIALTKEERDNEKVGGEVQKRLLAQTNELKLLEKQIGNTSRNVGNYKDEINEALKESGLFNKAQAAMATVQQAVSAATKVGTISTKSFGAALIATGIGAILVLFGSLVAYLTQTQKGMDLVAQATSAVGTFISVLIDGFSTLGEQLVNSIIPTFKGLGTIIEGILTLDFKQVKQGIKDVGNALGGIEGVNILEVGKAAAKAAAESAKLTKELQNLTREEKQLDLQRAQSRQNIEKLKLIAEDQTKSIQERSKASQEALDIELGLEAKAIKLQEEKIRIISAQNSLSKSKDEDNNKLIEAEIQLANLQQESATKQIALGNKLNSLRKKESDKQAAEKEKRAKEESDLLDKQSSDLDKKNKEELKRIEDQQDELNKVFQKKLIERSEQTELEIRETINELKRQFAEGQITPDEFKNQLAEIEAVAIETRRAAFELQLEETRNNSQIEADTKLEIEADLQQKIRDLNDQTLDVKVQNAQDLIKAEIVSAKSQEDLAKTLANSEIQARDAVLNATKSIFGEQSAAGKIAATFQATIDTFAAATAALKLPFPFGQIVAATTIATGLANVAKINARPVPKFAEGGGIEVSGASHAGGGVDVSLGGQTVANVEGGEGLFVMKKNAYQAIKSLSNFNEIHGGNSWFNGSKKFLADGGAISMGATPQIDRRSLQDAQTSIGSAMQQINVIARISDINRVNSEMKLVEMQGDLR